jgi:hypothetical protein
MKNIITKIVDGQREKKDVEIELLASMDREKRHEYIHKKRARKIKRVAIGTAIIGLAYAAGRISTSKFFKAPANHSNIMDNIPPVDALLGLDKAPESIDIPVVEAPSIDPVALDVPDINI